MSELEKLREFKASVMDMVAKKYDKDFDFNVEHWENGNYDDSYSYGEKCGEQDVLGDLSELLDKV
jgi:hypothetical protein